MSAKTRNMNIVFSEIFSRTPDRNGISFWAEFDGKRITCHVSHELLVRQFGAKNRTIKETSQTFRQHFPEICELARDRIANAGPNGEVSI